MRLIAITLMMAAILVAGCGGSPTEPQDAGFDYTANPFITIPLVAGDTMEFKLEDVFGQRSAQADFVIGTDMTIEEIRQYFAVETVSSCFIPEWRCLIYAPTLNAFQGMGYGEAMYYVHVIEEIHGIDVPNFPPDPPC